VNPLRLAELALIIAISALILSLAYSSYILVNSLASIESVKPSIRNDYYIVLEGFKLRNDGLYSASITISIDIIQDRVILARYTGSVRLKPGEEIGNLTLRLEDSAPIHPYLIDGYAQLRKAMIKTIFKIVLEPLISIKLEINETLGRLTP